MATATTPLTPITDTRSAGSPLLLAQTPPSEATAADYGLGELLSPPVNSPTGVAPTVAPTPAVPTTPQLTPQIAPQTVPSLRPTPTSPDGAAPQTFPEDRVPQAPAFAVPSDQPDPMAEVPTVTNSPFAPSTADPNKAANPRGNPFSYNSIKPEDVKKLTDGFTFLNQYSDTPMDVTFAAKPDGKTLRILLTPSTDAARKAAVTNNELTDEGKSTVFTTPDRTAINDLIKTLYEESPDPVTVKLSQRKGEKAFQVDFSSSKQPLTPLANMALAKHPDARIVQPQPEATVAPAAPSASGNAAPDDMQIDMFEPQPATDTPPADSFSLNKTETGPSGSSPPTSQQTGLPLCITAPAP
jgi:hypothetical protein